MLTLYALRAAPCNFRAVVSRRHLKKALTGARQNFRFAPLQALARVIFTSTARHVTCVVITQAISLGARCRVPNDENLGFINAQLTIARWYLERAATADSVSAANHVRSARHAYDVVVTLLPKITFRVQPESYAEVQRQLIDLRARLKSTGEPV